jgi:hypothetical protein
LGSYCTYGKRITKRGQQYKLGLDNLHFVYGKNYRNSLGDYFIMEYDKDIYKNLDYLQAVAGRQFSTLEK